MHTRNQELLEQEELIDRAINFLRSAKTSIRNIRVGRVCSGHIEITEAGAQALIQDAKDILNGG